MMSDMCLMIAEFSWAWGIGHYHLPSCCLILVFVLVLIAVALHYRNAVGRHRASYHPLHVRGY